MKLKLFSLLSAIVLLLSTSCGTNTGLTNAYNVSKCEYEYNSISDVKISQMNLSKGVTALQLPQILSILTGSAKSIPLDFTLNLNVTNPNTTPASLAGLTYVMTIDDVYFGTGTAKQGFDIEAGATQVYPLTFGVDLATLFTGDATSSLENIVKNIIGAGSSEQSTVKLQIKPTFNIENIPVTSPVYIPITFTIGEN